MDDDADDKDDSKRRTRNLSEKKRRDQFNMLVNELSAMVSTNNRKMDKSTVLKATIAFLKNHNETTVKSREHDVQEHWKPAFLSNEEFTYLILEALEGFVMVFSVTGCIHYASDSITSLLGHQPSDIVNMSLFDLVYEDDRPNLYNVLQNSGSNMDSEQNNDNYLSFQCHLRRGTLDFRDETTYELIQFHGNFRSNADNDDSLAFQQNDSRLFVCTGRLYTPRLIRDVSLVDPNRSEFTSRHSLEWKFLYLDHRASPIIGYLPFEVLGTSGYDYYHFDDLEKVVTCHEALMQKGELTSCYYRFLTKGQQWIWLQTRFYITYHQWNSKPQFVVCTHRVVRIKAISTQRLRAELGMPFLMTSVDVGRVLLSAHRDHNEKNPISLSVIAGVALWAICGTPRYADIAKSMKQECCEQESVSDSEGAAGGAMKEAAGGDASMACVSPRSQPSDVFPHSYSAMSHSQPASVKSASTSNTVATAGTAGWRRSSHVTYQAGGSDTASVSGESRDSQRNMERDAPMLAPEPTLVPQHGIGAQYLDPAPFVGAVGVPMPLAPLPVLMSPDQAQMQLQRKHEELQQMIVRQQEELRQVKEQLLLARLGILQPLINMPPQYTSPDDNQLQFEGGARGFTGPPYPPHTHHPHMPQ